MARFLGTLLEIFAIRRQLRNLLPNVSPTNSSFIWFLSHHMQPLSTQLIERLINLFYVLTRFPENRHQNTDLLFQSAFYYFHFSSENPTFFFFLVFFPPHTHEQHTIAKRYCLSFHKWNWKIKCDILSGKNAERDNTLSPLKLAFPFHTTLQLLGR